MSVKDSIHMVKTAAIDFFEDDAMTLGAALAFYTALSFAPLLVIMLWITGLLGLDAQRRIVEQIELVVGPEAAQAIEIVIRNADMNPSAGTIAGLLGIGALIFSATGVFAQLQAALNRIWDVAPKPRQGIWGWLRKRLLSLGMILAIAFLLLVSLAISAVLSMAVAGQGPLWETVNFVISLGVFTLLFAAIFRFLPDVQIAWKDVWVGAGLTAALFAVGKWGIGLYLGRSSIGSSYGAAGSLVVLLVWVYYSSLIVFFGAELTQAYARTFGSRILPDRHAVWAHHKPMDHEEKDGGTGSGSGKAKPTPA